MSYILDSLKKSEKERSSARHPAAGVVNTPAFIENDKKSPLYNYRVWLLLFLILLTLVVAYWSVMQPQILVAKPDASVGEAPRSSTSIADIAPAEQATQADVAISKPVKAVDNREEKARAIALYEQSIRQKKRQAIESLYTQEENVAGAVGPSDNVELINDQNDVRVTAEQIVALQQDDDDIEEANGTEASDKPKDVEIPSLYDLDILVKKQIPDIDYGAHIYATDHKSGFVILNGARRREGDQLRSGVFIERIDEEHVVLSYEGTVFSLPAMRSWSNN